MIAVQFLKDEDGRIALTVKGHAKKAEKGKDIVCAAASMLACTAAKIVCDQEGTGAFKEPPYLRQESGDFVLCCFPKAEYRNEILHVFFVIESGYLLLQEYYSQYLTLKLFEEA